MQSDGAYTHTIISQILSKNVYFPRLSCSCFGTHWAGYRDTILKNSAVIWYFKDVTSTCFVDFCDITLLLEL